MKRLAFLLCLTLTHGSILAAPISSVVEPLPDTANFVILKDTDATYESGIGTEYYLDDSAKLEIDQLQGTLPKKVNQSSTLSLGFTRAAIWIPLKIENQTSVETWYLRINYPPLDNIRLYSRNPADGKFSVATTGDTIPYNLREFKQRVFLLKIEVPHGQKRDFFLRVQSESSISIPIQILSPNRNAEITEREQYSFGLYFGIILVMALYNLFLFVSLRDVDYILYVGYMAAMGLVQLSTTGYLAQLFFTDNATFPNWAPPFSTFVTILATIAFTHSFLSIKKSFPKLNRIFMVSYLIPITGILISFIASYATSIRMSTFSVLIISPFLITVGLISWRSGNRAARFYVLSWAFLFTGAIIYATRNVGLIQHNAFTYASLQIGSAIEMILLSLALGDKINIYKAERETALEHNLEQQKQFLSEQTLAANSFARFVPREFLTYLGKDNIAEVQLGDAVEKRMAILFSDIRSFTELSATMTPAQNFAFLNSYLSRVGPITRQHNGFIDKYVGDAIMALFPSSIDDALNASIDMHTAVRDFNRHRVKKHYEPIRIGIGLHEGTLNLGTIGESERMDGTVIADAVNVASRIEHLNKYFETTILISKEAFSGATDPDRFTYRHLGLTRVRGKTEPVSIIEILDGINPISLDLIKETLPNFNGARLALENNDRAEARRLFQMVLDRNPADRVSQLYMERISK